MEHKKIMVQEAADLDKACQIADAMEAHGMDVISLARDEDQKMWCIFARYLPSQLNYAKFEETLHEF